MSLTQLLVWKKVGPGFEKAIQKKDYEAALQVARRFKRLFPRSPHAWLLVGDTMALSGADDSEMRELWRKGHNKCPYSLEIAAEFITCLLHPVEAVRKGLKPADVEEATNVVRDLEELWGDQGEVYWLKTILASRTQSREHTEPFLREALGRITQEASSRIRMSIARDAIFYGLFAEAKALNRELYASPHAHPAFSLYVLCMKDEPAKAKEYLAEGKRRWVGSDEALELYLRDLENEVRKRVPELLPSP